LARHKAALRVVAKRPDVHAVPTDRFPQRCRDIPRRDAAAGMMSLSALAVSGAASSALAEISPSRSSSNGFGRMKKARQQRHKPLIYRDFCGCGGRI
jgi:hypothetical protein